MLSLLVNLLFNTWHNITCAPNHMNISRDSLHTLRKAFTSYLSVKPADDILLILYHSKKGKAQRFSDLKISTEFTLKDYSLAKLYIEL